MENHPFITLYCSSCGTPVVFSVPCGLRLCSFCRSVKYGRLFSGYYKKIKRVPFIRISQITLTVPNFKYLTSGKIKRFYSNFIKLKRSSFFKKYISGGIAVIECKHSSDEKGWNLHLHMLVEASYLPQRDLSSLWQKITGDSFIVDIRRIRDTKRELIHLLKYFLKVPVIQGQDIDSLNLDYESSFSRIRTVVSFGSLYGKISKDKYIFNCPECGNTSYITEYSLLELSSASREISIRGDP